MDIPHEVLRLAVLVLLRSREGEETPFSGHRIRDLLGGMFERTGKDWNESVKRVRHQLRNDLIEFDASHNCLTDKGREVLEEIDRLVVGEGDDGEKRTWKVIEAMGFQSFSHKITIAEKEGGKFVPETFRFSLYEGRRWYAGVVKFSSPAENTVLE